MKVGRPETPIENRFWKKVDKNGPNGCWNFTGAKLRGGYGGIKRKDGAQLKAHRFSYELHNGPIPIDLCVCHICDNPACVNPAHLFLGTVRENTHDMIAKGRKVVSSGSKNGMAKLSNNDVSKIRNDQRNQRDIANDYGISQSQVSCIKSRKSWKSL